MSATGTNNTVKWVLSNGVLTISPVSGNSGIAYKTGFFSNQLDAYITLTESEKNSVVAIVFSGDISLNYSASSKATSLSYFLTDSDATKDAAFPNLLTIDVSGLNTSGVEDFTKFFSKSLSSSVDGITGIIGLNNLDVSDAYTLREMFSGVFVDSLDLSSFPLNDIERISGLIGYIPYCRTVTLPANFYRMDNGLDNDYKYFLGLASSSVPATKNGVTITSDEDFFKLDSAQGGTWTRDISGTATLKFKVTSTERDGSTATFNYSYATTEATVSVYMKESTVSSYSSTPQDTFTVLGAGTGTYSTTLATDNSYDFKIVVNDGTTSLYLFPSVDSNVLLVSFDENGDMYVSGSIAVDGDARVKLNWDGSSVPSDNNEKHYEALDTSERWIGRVSNVVYDGSSSRSGQVSTLIRARHPSAPNNPNTIGIYVDDTGAMDYTISSPSAFRSAIGIPYYITSEESANGWVWRKFSDKTFEAWYSGTATTAINSAVGSLYQSGSSLTLTIPSGIGATSVLYGDVMMFSSSYGVWAYVLGMTSSTITYRGFSAVSRASASYTVKAYIRGAYS